MHLKDFRMKKETQKIIEKIQQSDLARIDQDLLIDLLKKETANKTNFIKSFLQIVGVSKAVIEVFKLFDIDISELIDKFL
jgi:hypothetical protein